MHTRALHFLSYAALLLGAASPSLAAYVLSPAPVGLKCEDLVDPSGIDATAPRLSWHMGTDRPGARQAVYHVLVASSPELLRARHGDLWDSGKVHSDRSLYIPYGGAPLRSGEECWWSVQILEDGGHWSETSAPAHWSMGLLHPEDWTGQWIGQDEHQAPIPFVGAQWIWTFALPPPPNADPLIRYLRGSFELPAGCTVRSSHLIVACSCDQVASINGFSLYTAPATPKTLAQDYDLTWRLKPGRNVLAFSLLPHAAGASPALLARVEVELMDGRKLAFSSDGQWKGSAFPAPGWEAIAFDDSTWTPVQVEGEPGAAPWGAYTRPGSRRLAARYLRREFSANRPVRRAVVYYCGLGSSELYLNGQRVGDEIMAPGLSEIPVRAYYLTHDVTALVRLGRNAVGAILGNGRYYAPRRGAPFGDVYPKLMLKLVIEYRDGSSQTVVSGPAWKLTDQGPIRANNEYDGEEFDARREFQGWSRSGFDDSAWKAAEVVSPGARRLSAQMFPPMRVTDTLPAKSLREIDPGVYLFDLGQNMVGHCRLQVQGPAGTRVILRHAETVGPDGRPRFENLRTAMATDVYTLKGGGEEIHEPRFTYHGFRYVEVRGYPGTPALSAIEGREVHDDLQPIGDWVSSSKLLNQIYRNMTWGIRDNYRSIPTDCPQRDERMGWTGDRVYESKGEAFVFHTAPLYRKWFQDMADGQRKDGSISDVCPTYWPRYNDDVTWPGAFVASPEGLYEESGDPGFVTRLYPQMRKWVLLIQTHLVGDLLPDDRYGDWCPPPENPEFIHSEQPQSTVSAGFMATSHFYHILRLMESYARIAGHDDDASGYGQTADRLKAAFNRAYLASDGSHYDTGSQASFVLPLAFGLVPDHDRAAVEAGLAQRIDGPDHGHVDLGAVGIQHLMQTLTDAGQADRAYRMATQETYPSWGYMVRHQATTVWELWNGDTADVAMNSGNHVMLIGDCVTWLYENLAGIKSDPLHPGYHHILMRPTPAGGLTSVKASLLSPYGRISSAWRIENGRFVWDVVVPPNCTATISPPDGSAPSEVGPGPYRFICNPTGRPR